MCTLLEDPVLANKETVKFITETNISVIFPYSFFQGEAILSISSKHIKQNFCLHISVPTWTAAWYAERLRGLIGTTSGCFFFLCCDFYNCICYKGSLNFSPFHANMMSVAVQCMGLRVILQFLHQWKILSSAARDKNAVMNQKKAPANILFKADTVRDRAETRNVWWVQISVTQSQESWGAFVPVEGDRESLGCKAAKIWGKTWINVVWQRGLMICGSFSWQWGKLCGGKLLCTCTIVKTEKLTLLKLQLEHEYDCWHCCFCSGPRNHIRCFKGPPETGLVMCNGAAGPNWQIFWLRIVACCINWLMIQIWVWRVKCFPCCAKMEIALMALRQIYDDKNCNDSGWPGLVGQIKGDKYDEFSWTVIL